jgi:hypothetical protein
METSFILFFNSALGLTAIALVGIALSALTDKQPVAIAIPVRSNEK